jgi:hypothetical protein
MQRAGAPFVSMTGAGPALYTATPEPALAGALQSRLIADLGLTAESFLCQPIPAIPAVEVV